MFSFHVPSTSATLDSVDTEGGPRPASRCRTRTTGWGSDGAAQKMLLGRAGFGTCLVLAVLDALLAAWFLATGSPGPGLGSRRSPHCSSWPRFCSVRERHARPRARTRIQPASESGAAAPPLRAGLPSNNRVGDGIGARSVARGGSAAEVAQQHQSRPFVIMVDGVWGVRYSPVQRVRGAATAQLSVRGSLAGPQPELGDLGDHRVRAVAAPSTP